VTSKGHVVRKEYQSTGGGLWSPTPVVPLRAWDIYTGVSNTD